VLALRAALVAMPFATARHPSLQLGLLQAVGRRRGLAVETFPLNLDLARSMGMDAYDELCRYRGRLAADWLFSIEAFGPDAPDQSGRFLEAFGTELRAHLDERKLPVESLARIRSELIPSYLDRVCDEVPWAEFQVVGFTTTFQQAVASAALARRIKARHPGVVTVFGGAACDSEMGLELMRAAPWVDYAISGEGDEAFPEFIEALAHGRDPAAVAGVVARRDGEVAPAVPRPAFTHLDDLPAPTYEDWFERAAALGVLPEGGPRDVVLPFEAARGCWWGRCLFCGLARETRTFRPKSARRVVDEIGELSADCGSLKLESADLVLGRDEVPRALDELARRDLDYELFWETRSSLSREELARMRRAGVVRIQPGIESLNTRTLRLMRKGTTALQGVNLLRWALHFGIDVSWNLLWGFPGEDEADYRAQVRLVRLLPHLQPPQAVTRFWLERFSPLFVERERFRFTAIDPEESYAYVYPSATDPAKLAYFFRYTLADTLPDDAFVETAEAIAAWLAAWTAVPRPRLTLHRADRFVEIEDARGPGRPGTYTFMGELAALYLACSDGPRTPAEVARAQGGADDEEAVKSCLDEFCALDLMVQDGGQYLSLAVPPARS
jgi:ribosomal peptide maturation radical SAM protein 1